MKTTTRIPSGTTGELWTWAEERRRTSSSPVAKGFARRSGMAAGILRRLASRLSAGTFPR